MDAQVLTLTSGVVLLIVLALAGMYVRRARAKRRRHRQ